MTLPSNTDIETEANAVQYRGPERYSGTHWRPSYRRRLTIKAKTSNEARV